jgi:hypothetical protein
LILELRANLGATIVVVTHELASIFTIANNSVFPNRAHTPEFRSILRDVRKLRDWMVERNEFELSVPILQQIVYDDVAVLIQFYLVYVDAVPRFASPAPFFS